VQTQFFKNGNENFKYDYRQHWNFYFILILIDLTRLYVIAKCKSVCHTIKPWLAFNITEHDRYKGIICL